MSILLTASKYLSLLGAFAVIGSLLAMAFLLLDKDGLVSQTGERVRSFLKLSSALWFVGTLATIIFSLAQILNTSITQALNPTVLRSFVTQISIGQYLTFQATVALFVFIASFSMRKILTLIVILAISLLGLIAPVFQSHSTSGGSHAFVIGTLVIHVAAISLWVGGVLTLAMLSSTDRVIAVPRFSQLALWSALAVVISGSLNAWARLNFAGSWNSAYSFVIAAKVLATFALLGIGNLHRKNLQGKKDINWISFGKLLSVEAIIMGVVVAMGTWLSTNSSPDRPGAFEFNAAVSVVGFSTPPEPNWSRILWSYEPNALIIGILIILVALYIKGVLVLVKRGDKWPIGRTISFALGIAATDFATSGGLGMYAHFSFSYHMISHMVLGMIAPIAFVLSAPITLALRTLPQGRTPTERGVRGSLLAALHSRVGVILTNPVVALFIFDGSLFALYFTDLFGKLMPSHLGHLLMSFHFLVAGFLFFSVIIGIDPNPRKIPYLVKIVVLFAAMSIHAFFSVALMSTTTLIDGGYFASLQTPWLTDLLADQKLGGSIGWAMGEIPILLALVATFIQWMRDDSRETKRIDRNIARQAALGQPDDLANYNVYLEKLNKRDREGS